MPKIKLKDASYYYELTGKGEPLILISGYTCDHTIWQSVVDLLKESYTILTIDNRGIGQTTDAAQTLSIRLLAEDILTISQQLGLEKPHIAGHSMGGAIALHIAKMAGSLIGKVAIINSTSKLRNTTLFALEGLLNLRRKGTDFDTLFENSFPWFYGDEFLSNKSNIELLKQQVLKNPFPQSLENQERQFNILQNLDEIINLKAILNSTLVICGTQDIIALPVESEMLVKALAHAQLQKISCGHASVQEKPEAITELLTNFLSKS